MKRSLLSFAFGLLIAGLAFAGDAAADKKKAAEDRKKAAELYGKAQQAHNQATKDFDAAVALQMTADADAAAARKLMSEAILLDKEAAKECQVEHLKQLIAEEELAVAYWKNALKHTADHEKAVQKTIAEEEKAITDMQAAAKAETKPDNKKLEETIVANDQADVKNLQGQLKKLQDDAKADEGQVSGHEASLASYKKHLKELGG
jgi:hypothetical protein